MKIQNIFSVFIINVILFSTYYIFNLSKGEFDHKRIIDLRKNTLPLFLFSSICYLPAVYFLKKLYPCNKDSRLLQQIHIIWNISLSIFSGIGFLILFNHIIFHRYDCSLTVGITGKWITLFCLSKIPELMDTFFIILRGKPLISLQWFHHIATLLLCWLGIYCYPLESLDAAVINYFIHFIMYAYFAFYDLGFTFLKNYNRYITYLQVLQMIYMTILISIRYNNDTIVCHFVSYKINHITGIAGLSIYAIYIILFGQLLLPKKRLRC